MTAAIQMSAVTAEILIFGRPAETARCHRCGQLVIDPAHPGQIRDMLFASDWPGTAHYIEHTWHRPRNGTGSRWSRWGNRLRRAWRNALASIRECPQQVRYSAEPHDDEEMLRCPPTS